jgi:hypothetical protein
MPLAEGDRGVILRLNVIPLGTSTELRSSEGPPLEGGFFSLPQTPVVFGEFSLNVPALRIPVRAAAPNPAAAAPAAAQSAADATAEIAAIAPVAAPAIPFPAIEIRVFPPFRSACEDIRERAEALWNEGRRIEALAELRRNERDHFAGPALIPLRREAERVLGFEQVQGGNEKWRPRGLLALGLFGSLGLLILSGILRFFRKKNTINIPYAVTLNFSRGYRCILIILAVIAGLCLYGLGDSFRHLLPGSVRYALVRETEARRVPEPDGAVNVRFNEGERALVRSGRLDWAYAESMGSSASPEGGVGWVRIGDIIFY